MPVSDVFNIDCMEGTKQYPDKYFDLAIVDPPFGLSDTTKNKFRRNKKTFSYKNRTIPPPEYFTELTRVCVHTIIFGCQYMMPFLDANGSFIVWNKNANPDLHNMSACDIAWYSKRERIRIFHGTWCGAVKFETTPTIHIHQKPVGLYKWLLSHYTQTGFKILDTHLGSGSSRIAAYDMGFDFTAFEIDKDYFEAQEKRFKQHTSQLTLI
jgi:site-specific DNA-methyltransferase (adenine-specific)